MKKVCVRVYIFFVTLQKKKLHLLSLATGEEDEERREKEDGGVNGIDMTIWERRVF